MWHCLFCCCCEKTKTIMKITNPKTSPHMLSRPSQRWDFRQDMGHTLSAWELFGRFFSWSFSIGVIKIYRPNSCSFLQVLLPRIGFWQFLGCFRRIWIFKQPNICFLLLSSQISQDAFGVWYYWLHEYGNWKFKPYDHFISIHGKVKRFSLGFLNWAVVQGSTCPRSLNKQC